MSWTINFPTDDGIVLFMQDKVNAAEIKDGTIKVWLNNDTPYVFNYKNREMAKKNFDKLNKYLNEEDEKSINEKLIEKACKWLRKELVNFEDYSGMGEELISDFRKAMEE